MIFFGRMGPTALPVVVARSGKYHHEAHDKNLVVVAPGQPIPPAFRPLSAQSRVAASQRSARGQQALHTHEMDFVRCHPTFLCLSCATNQLGQYTCHGNIHFG